MHEEFLKKQMSKPIDELIEEMNYYYQIRNTISVGNMVSIINKLHSELESLKKIEYVGSNSGDTVILKPNNESVIILEE